MIKAILFATLFVVGGLVVFAFLAPLLFRGANMQQVGAAAFPFIFIICGAVGFIFGWRKSATTNESVTDSPNNPASRKERHGCVTTYLIFMILVNSGFSLLYLFGSDRLRQNGMNMPDWAFLALATAGVVNVICAVALLKWKRWGFWGFVVSAIAIFAVNLAIGLGPLSGIGGAAGVLVLYGVLQIGKERKAWSQLE